MGSLGSYQRILTAGYSDPLCPTSLIARLLASGNERKQFESPKITTWVDHETNLSGLIGIPGSIVLTPTHTEGSLVLMMDNVAFMGDLVRGSMISSAAETDFYLCDVEANRQAVRSFLEKGGRGVQIFFPGHFGPTISRDAMVYQFNTKDDQ